MTNATSRQIKRRAIVQWSLIPVVLLTIGLGWKYPLCGFSVPLVMLAGIIGGIFRGRYVCGNICPRGGFFDRILRWISRNRPIPNAIRNNTFRWTFFATMMGFMVYRVSMNPADIYHWGKVFWMMCVITTAIGVVFGILIHQRSWCAFCPMGTMQNALGGRKKHMRIDKDLCVECGSCEKACPFNLAIIIHKDTGVIADPDCLKCSECIAACPKNALSHPCKQMTNDQ